MRSLYHILKIFQFKYRPLGLPLGDGFNSNRTLNSTSIGVSLFLTVGLDLKGKNHK